MERGDFRSRIDPKPSLNEETGRENLEREKLGHCAKISMKITMKITYLLYCLYH